jgi:hypothetical protein
VIGTAAAWFTITLSEARPPSPEKIAVMSALVAGSYALVGAILTHWLPEPKPELDAADDPDSEKPVIDRPQPHA